MPAGPDRPSNPGPSRPANPGPNNPNYNLNPSWPPGEQWPRTPTSPDHHFEPHYGFDSNHQRKSFRDFPPRDNFDRREEFNQDDRHFDNREIDHPPRYDHHTMIGDFLMSRNNFAINFFEFVLYFH